MIKLTERTDISGNVKALNRYQQFGRLVRAIDETKLTPDTIDLIDHEIEALNVVPSAAMHFSRAIKTRETQVIRILEKRHKIVPRNYYRKLWMLLGMSAFGTPVGVTLGSSTGNMGFFGLGIGIGMAVGMALGTKMDKKAFEEGRQLDFEVK
jgi:hypothetical protein